MEKTSIKKRGILIAIVTVIIGIYVFFAAPNLNPVYSDGAFFWLVVLTIYTLLIGITTLKLPRFTVQEGTNKVGVDFDKTGKPKKWIIISLAALWAAYILVNLIFSPLFFWGKYKEQLPEPEVKQFTSEVQAVDISQIPIVDSDLAKTLADKKLGEKPALGSQVVLGEPTIQSVDGELTWVVPLHHSGFFKWMANMDGAAGYIKVSATNLQDVEYVDSYKIKIQPNSYFMDDLTRVARFKGGIFDGITDYSFELNDEGKPYWIVTTYKNTCGFNLPEANGILLVDAQTGDVEKYSMDNIPEWVDRVQPESFLLNQINNKGKYIHGIFNFSNFEKFQASKGSNIIYNNGHCYYFTGITSIGVDESATGFMMIDMVTKEPILYRISGATELASQTSAEGKVQDLGYQATMPIILNVYNEPTYFMTLKDDAQLIKKYAFVNVKDYMIVGVGDSMSEAQADYAKSMKNISSKPGLGNEATNREVVEGTIARINFTVTENQTAYYFMLEEKPNEVFVANLSLNEKLPLTQIGDKVKLEYIKVEGSKAHSIVLFENTTL